MKKILDEQEVTTTTHSTKSLTTNDESIAQQQQQQQRRRLRQTSSRQTISPPKLQADEWETEASGMEGELMDYFLEQKGKKPKQTDEIGEKISPQRSDEMKGNHVQQRIENKYNNDLVHKNPKRMAQSSTNADCENSNGALPCPPDDLPQKCDKYNGGDFESCFNMCIESFCCIHESTSNIARSCSKDLNCPHYAPCYIIWWKLQDTIGPRFIRTDQRDNPDFFNLPVERVEESTTASGIPFIFQVYLHHFDDDGFIGDEFVRNPDNW